MHTLYCARNERDGKGEKGVVFYLKKLFIVAVLTNYLQFNLAE